MSSIPEPPNTRPPGRTSFIKPANIKMKPAATSTSRPSVRRDTVDQDLDEILINSMRNSIKIPENSRNESDDVFVAPVNAKASFLTKRHSDPTGSPSSTRGKRKRHEMNHFEI